MSTPSVVRTMWGLFKYFAVPLVAIISKFKFNNFFATLMILFLLSLSIDKKTFPEVGKMIPDAI